jgi:glucose-1-phosphate cytidylyltransferase
MKVVLFCGGLGTRLREFSDTIPKPLVNVGPRPILWHLMKYYAHFGHKDFILCLGYRGDMIKDYFLNYDPYKSMDFVMAQGGRALDPDQSDIHDWTIRFADTGLHANLGQRLMSIREHLAGDEVFMANYGDSLSDLDLGAYLDTFMQTDTVASFLAVRPSQSFHTVQMDDESRVSEIAPIADSDCWINGGYMAFRREIFDYIQEGEELVEQPFRRLIAKRKLLAQKYRGFWKAMDTFKDKIEYDRMDGVGDRPWQLW